MLIKLLVNNMVSLRKTRLKHYNNLRERMKKEGRLKKVKLKNHQPMSMKIGLLRMGFDVEREN